MKIELFLEVDEISEKVGLGFEDLVLSQPLIFPFVQHIIVDLVHHLFIHDVFSVEIEPLQANVLVLDGVVEVGKAELEVVFFLGDLQIVVRIFLHRAVDRLLQINWFFRLLHLHLFGHEEYLNDVFGVQVFELHCFGNDFATRK